MVEDTSANYFVSPCVIAASSLVSFYNALLIINRGSIQIRINKYFEALSMLNVHNHNGRTSKMICRVGFTPKSSKCSANCSATKIFWVFEGFAVCGHIIITLTNLNTVLGFFLKTHFRQQKNYSS